MTDLPRLLLIADAHRERPGALEAAVAAGAPFVQLRDKDLGDAAVLDRLRIVLGASSQGCPDSNGSPAAGAHQRFWRGRGRNMRFDGRGKSLWELTKRSGVSDSLPRRGGLRRAGDLQAAGPPSRTALRSVRSHNRAIDRNVFRSGSGKYACAAVQNTGCLIAINGRPAMARREGIGLHLPAAHGSVARDGIALLGRSAHDEEEVQRAVAEGVDYLIVGTIFPSASKPGRAPLGLDGLARLTALAAPLPVFAIGGITPTRVASVLEAGAHGVAVCSAVLDVPDAAVATQNFLAELPT